MESGASVEKTVDIKKSGSNLEGNQEGNIALSGKISLGTAIMTR